MVSVADKIATVCECIDHCFAFAIWCDDFARSVDSEDMVMGLARGHELVSDATRLQSFLALRKLDDFLGGVRPNSDDLTAADFDIDVRKVVDDDGGSFLTQNERTEINKGVAHLTEQLTLGANTEVHLREIVSRSLPAFSQLVAELRARDGTGEASYWLNRTDKLMERITALYTIP